MRICYSSIAWEVAEEPAAAALLRAQGIDAVDVVPGRYFPDPGTATESEARRVRDWWRDQGIEVLGMQALLFGAKGLNLFGDARAQESLADRLANVFRVAAWMGARRLVFGSPRNRDRGAMTPAEAVDVAVPWFRALGERAADFGVVLCLEPNPPRYECNFMTTTDEAARVVRAVDHQSIRLHLDAGTMAVNGEDPARLLAAHGDLVGYAHVSEPDLAPISTSALVHGPLCTAIRARRPDLPVSIEMRAAGLGLLEPTLERVRGWYGDRA